MALIINGKKIDDDAIYQEFENIKQNFEEQSGQFTCCEHDDEFMGYAKQNLISRTLLSQKAMATCDPVSPDEIENAMDELIEQQGGRDDFLANYGLGEDQVDDFKQDVASNLLINKLLDREIGDTTAATDEELKAFYDENIEAYMTPERVSASHILKSLTHGEDRAQAFETLKQVRVQLKAGGDFAALAEEHSDNPENGGELGLFGRGELVEEFEAVVFSMDDGELSPVFLTPFGYHVARVNGREAATPKPFDEVKDEVAQAYLQQRRETLVREYVDKLQLDATIEEIEEPEEAEVDGPSDAGDPVESVASDD